MAQTNGHANGITNGHTNGTSTEKVVLTKETEFPLSINNLEDVATFEHTDAGLSLVSKVKLPAGAHFAYITSHGPREKPTWRTIQTSATTHTDPLSALLYMNHSCAPSVEVHAFSPDKDGKYPTQPPNGLPSSVKAPEVSDLGIAGEVRVARDRGIEPGQALTFFYPCTEWKFDRAFDCLCGAPKDVCLGRVEGASAIPKEKLGKWFFNEHILKLAEKRDQ